ncbi:hypothetical protein DFH28DRAFT_951100 [Melampsora americana]|nr:hypothetical protein DFH28DRAFT_951100 [Melampsora americana]
MRAPQCVAILSSMFSSLSGISPTYAKEILPTVEEADIKDSLHFLVARTPESHSIRCMTSTPSQVVLVPINLHYIHKDPASNSSSLKPSLCDLATVRWTD